MLEDWHASTLTLTLPPVPFLKPIAHDIPEASWRWTCDSVVRAPIAPQTTRSAMYCGVMVSRNSTPERERNEGGEEKRERERERGSRRWMRRERRGKRE
jgi:hypothetical protein|tara:strand:- start:1380 stop:1676 length:297 start_codon:yes stop_codon:yes gene_type:complete